MIAKAILSLSLAVGGVLPPTSVSKHDLPEPVDISASARCPQWWQLAVDAGWRQSLLPTLDYLMWRESRCDPASHNTDDPMGGSRGLVQINGFWTPWLADRGIVRRSAGLFDPYRNLRAALAIYNYSEDRNDNGFAPWRI